jgi:hypothetical protein
MPQGGRVCIPSAANPVSPDVARKSLRFIPNPPFVALIVFNDLATETNHGEKENFPDDEQERR